LRSVSLATDLLDSPPVAFFFFVRVLGTKKIGGRSFVATCGYSAERPIRFSTCRMRVFFFVRVLGQKNLAGDFFCYM